MSSRQVNKQTPKFFSLSLRLWGMINVIGVVVCSATLFGFLGRFYWFSDLFTHFRVQYLVALSILVFLLLLGRYRRTAAILTVFACLNLGVILPLYFGGNTIAPEASHTLRAMLINVNTQLGDVERVKQVIHDVNPDILVLEEISSQWVRDLKGLAQSHPYSRIHPREDNFGIGLFSKFPLTNDEIVYICDAAVPSIIATVDTVQGTLCIIATHPLPPAGAAYSRQRNDQLARLPDYVPLYLPVILLGDLNVTPWNYHFKKLLKHSLLTDSSQGRGIQPTWPTDSPLLLIPLDHCLHSASISVINKWIGKDVGSDHYPVIVDFVIKTE